MLFKNLRRLAEVEESDDDISYEETEEEEYESEEIHMAIDELTSAVVNMKKLVQDVISSDLERSQDEDKNAIKMATEIYRSHLKISWDETRTHDVLPTLKNYEIIQEHLKELNYKFVHLDISEFRYELLRNILVAKLVYLIRRILYKVY
ncbi:MAG: hypothetical protein ACTSVL_13250 [Promethearchaeota archaeon]